MEAYNIHVQVLEVLVRLLLETAHAPVVVKNRAIVIGTGSNTMYFKKSEQGLTTAINFYTCRNLSGDLPMNKETLTGISKSYIPSPKDLACNGHGFKGTISIRHSGIMT